MSTATIFFSWQSDRPTREGRNTIEAALEAAVKRISGDFVVEEPFRELRVDKDTKDVPGLPPIFHTILEKIDRATVFVPDLTFVSQRPNGDPSPNPNVLIEFGYALKSLTHVRIVAVMNTAHGQPARDSLPFDLALHRFPITYHLPDGAPDEVRRSARERLTKELEAALKAVLNSDEYKATLPKVAPVAYREPLQGRARFWAKGKPLGFGGDRLNSLIGGKDRTVSFAEGPAIWLRVMPSRPVPKPFRIADLQKLSQVIVNLPFPGEFPNVSSLRSSDGCGFCTVLNDEPSPSVIFVFADGDVWLIDTFPLRAAPDRILLNENAMTKSLQQCSAFLNEQLKIPGPYRWVAGIEGVAGRVLPLRNDRFGRTRGPCAADVIEEEGLFKPGDDAVRSLEPFFQKVFEQCGVAR